MADRAEPDLPRGREVRRPARRARAAQGRPLPPPRRGQPRGQRARQATRETIWKVVTPRWRRHLDRLVIAGEGPDAVLVFTVPMAHFRGIPTHLRERHGVPVVFYDGDVPMSLPEFGGMDTGFNYYHGADPSEYDLVLSNSEGGLERLLELGADGPRPSLGRRPGVLRRSRSRRRRTSSSTATATSSGASGWRRWSASRAGATRASTSRSAAGTSRATSGAPVSSATCRSTSSPARSRRPGST